jgi:hypothetical protein
VPYAAIVCASFWLSQSVERISKGRCRIGMRVRAVYLWIALGVTLVQWIYKMIAEYARVV